MIVTFDWAAFQALFPQFTPLGSSLAQLYFNMATLYVANTDAAIIPYDTTLSPPVTTRADILNLTTAHIAQILSGTAANPASPLVGRVSDATQGSVSVSAEWANAPASAGWWLQTPFGALAWTAMAPFRTAQYRPSPGRFAQIPGNGQFVPGAPFSNQPWGGPWGFGNG